MAGRGRFTVALLLGAAASWTLIVATEALPRPDDGQRRALALMQAPYERAIGERNAFQLFWLLPYSIPPAERAQVMAEDVAALDGASDPPSGDHAAADRYPRRWPRDGEPVPVCRSDTGCLDEVRADPVAVRAVLQQRADALADLHRLGEFDHLRTPYRQTAMSPLPEYAEVGSMLMADAALAHVDGDSERALQGLCRDMAALRRLKGRSDNLIFEMINLAWQRRGAQLYNDIRAELPADRALPAQCAAAYGPPLPEERFGCDVYRAEFALNVSLLDGVGGPLHAGTWWERAATGLLVNRAATTAIMAEQYAAGCASGTAALVRSAPPPATCSAFARVFNPGGCVLAEMAVPHLGQYRDRERDADARLLLIALGDWLVAQPDPAAAFEQRPDALRIPDREVRFIDDELIVDQPGQSSGTSTPWRIRLPGSRADGGGNTVTTVGADG